MKKVFLWSHHLSDHNTEKYYQPGVFVPAVQYVSSSNFYSKASKKYDTYLLFGKNTDAKDVRLSCLMLE